MIVGLNVSPLAHNPRRGCYLCDGIQSDIPICDCSSLKRTGAIHAIQPYQIVKLTNKGDAIDIECVGCHRVAGGSCGQHTPADVHLRLFIEDGNAYAQIAEGRVKQRFLIQANLTTTTGRMSVYLKAEII